MRSGLILALLAAALSPQAQNQVSQKTLSDRQYIIHAMLTTDRRESVAKTRLLCMEGEEWDSVREARSEGQDFTPDASDECIAALQRDAKDGQMIYIYQKLVTRLGGNPAVAYTLPRAIGNSVLSGDGKVPIGNKLVATVTPQIALDAGFTVAVMDNAARKAMAPDKLKAAAEDCLAGKDDAGTCFSIGYIYGTQAVTAR